MLDPEKANSWHKAAKKKVHKMIGFENSTIFEVCTKVENSPLVNRDRSKRRVKGKSSVDSKLKPLTVEVLRKNV